LNKEKTVSDTKVKSLEEELNKYKMAFARVSSVAAKSQSIEKEAKQLQEQLAQKDARINELEGQMSNSKSLNESLNSANNGKIKLLTEKIDVMQKEFDEEKASLSEQLATAKQKANDSISVARQYKAKLEETLNKYIDSKAEMLGVRASDIKSRLSEKYSIKDIDSLCDEMLNESVGFSRLPFGMSGIKITEAKAPTQVATKSQEDEIADWVLEGAGLKK
jgi:chromosome segregation ATPase